MSSGSVSLRQLARNLYNQPPTQLKLREMVRLGNRASRLRIRRAPFSLMTQNMGLLVAPAPYLGTDRGGAIAEIISRITQLSPDVVGLCEVFANDERHTIWRGVRHIYRHVMDGPDEDDYDSDGGLLLLSKHEILRWNQVIYRDCAGGDCFANKGIIYVQVHPPNSPTPYNIFFSHMQNIEEKGGKGALYGQLIRMRHEIQYRAHPYIPAFIMGDLNIPGEVPEHYDQLIRRLARPVDLWTVAGNTPESGFTFSSDNNFYEDSEDIPARSQRLDYILMRPGLEFIPLLANIEILKFARGGRFISDHFGLHARFEQLVHVDF